MKTKLKSILAVALCAVGLSAFAEEPASNEIWYTATAKLAEVTGTGTTAGLHKEVFEDADGKTLTMESHTWDETTGKGVITFDGGIATVGENAFRSCKVLSSITIPASVTSIGNSAFYMCSDIFTKTGLTTVTFAEGSKLETIGEQAFYYCMLSSITIPASVTSIGKSAFNSCSSLTTVTFAEGSQLETIGESAFYYCMLSSITIPASVTSIGKSAFSACSLTTVTFAEGSKLGTIGESAFSGCKVLSTITIPASVTSIEKSAFQNCYDSSKETGLAEVIFAEGSQLGTIGYMAFYNCKALSSITIPASVTSIGESAFHNCYDSSKKTGLAEVTFADGSKLETIGKSAFYGCSALSSITIPASVTSIGTSAFQKCEVLSSITISASVTSIEKSAFSECSSLTTVTFAEGSQLGTIGEEAFYGCSALSSITIPASVTSIGKSAFQSCYDSSKETGLTTVTFAEGSQLGTIGGSAFSGCSALSSIVIPASVTSIGMQAFSSCPALESISVDAKNSVYSSPDNCNAIIETAKNTLIQGCKNTVIPESVEIIGNSAFSGCSSLTTVTFAEGSKLETIGEKAFYECSALSSIAIPASVTSIGTSAFSKCSSLTTVTFAEGSKLGTIGGQAFYNCKVLSSITIPASVTSIGNSAFSGCSSLTTVTFAEGSQLGTIGQQAFYNCIVLSSITIPASVTSIGIAAFANCSGIESVIVNWTEADKIVKISSNVFSNCPEGMTLIVPAGTESLYAAATGWSSYKDKIVEAYLVSGVAEHGSVSFDKTCFPADSYTEPTETVTVTATPEKGYLLKSLVWNDGTDHDITEAKSFPMPLACVTVTAVFEEKSEISAVSAEGFLDLTVGDRIAAVEEPIVADPKWGNGERAYVEIEGESTPREYPELSIDTWFTTALTPGRYAMTFTSGETNETAAFWKIGDDWVVQDLPPSSGEGIFFESGKTHLILGTTTFTGDAPLEVEDGAKFEYGAGAGFKGGKLEAPRRYGKVDVEGGLFQIVEKIKGCEDNPWDVGEGVTAYTNGTELVIGGEGTITDLSDIPAGVKDAIDTVTVPEATVKGAADDAFLGLGGFMVSLPDNWQGELPNAGGNWYGATSVGFTRVPMAVKNVKVTQRYPWNGLVDVTFDLTGEGYVAVAVQVTTNGVMAVENPTVTGTTTFELARGGELKGQKITWDAKADFGDEEVHEKIKVKLSVSPVEAD